MLVFVVWTIITGLTKSFGCFLENREMFMLIGSLQSLFPEMPDCHKHRTYTMIQDGANFNRLYAKGRRGDNPLK